MKPFLSFSPGLDLPPKGAGNVSGIGGPGNWEEGLEWEGASEEGS